MLVHQTVYGNIIKPSWIHLSIFFTGCFSIFASDTLTSNQYMLSILHPSFKFFSLAIYIMICTQKRRPANAVVGQAKKRPILHCSRLATYGVAPSEMGRLPSKVVQRLGRQMAVISRRIIFRYRCEAFQATRRSGKWSGRWSRDDFGVKIWGVWDLDLWILHVSICFDVAARPQLKRLATPQLQQSFQCFSANKTARKGLCCRFFLKSRS